MVYLLLILSVLLSYIFVLLFQPKKQSVIRLLLVFSGAFLLALTVFDLLPDVYKDADPKMVGVFILLGMLIQIFLEFYSRGLEHGHLPHHANSGSSRSAIFASLCIHALLEGIPIESYEPILVGIIIHKIPIAIILSFLLINSNLSRLQSTAIILVFAIMTPLGSYLAHHLPVLQDYQPYLMALIIGVFLHISTVILLESSEGHRFNKAKLLVILLGMITAYFI